MRSAEKEKNSPHNWRRSSLSSTPDSGINVTWTDVEPYGDLSNVSKDLDESIKEDTPKRSDVQVILY